MESFVPILLLPLSTSSPKSFQIFGHSVVLDRPSASLPSSFVLHFCFVIVKTSPFGHFRQLRGLLHLSDLCSNDSSPKLQMLMDNFFMVQALKNKRLDVVWYLQNVKMLRFSRSQPSGSSIHPVRQAKSALTSSLLIHHHLQSQINSNERPSSFYTWFPCTRPLSPRYSSK